jgi:hypothetical protein
MGKIEIIIKDDAGKVIKKIERELNVEIQKIGEIEKSVDEIRQKMLPEITEILLTEGQEKYKKKRDKK